MDDVIIDTNVVSYFFNEHSLSVPYYRLLNGSRMFISFATLGELHEGANRGMWGMRKHESLQTFLRNYSVRESNEKVSEIWGWLRSHRKRQPISENDAWIAATAISNMPLATHNVADFAGIPGLKVLTV